MKNGGIPLLPPVGQRSILVLATTHRHVELSAMFTRGRHGALAWPTWRQSKEAALEGREPVRGEGAGKARCPWDDLEHHQLGADVM